MPRLLELFARHRLGCIWATVGMLFFEERTALLAALPDLRPGNAEAESRQYYHPTLWGHVGTGLSRGVW